MGPNRDGGSHLTGLLRGIVDGVRAHAARLGQPIPRGITGARKRVCRGLRGVVSVRLHDPAYDSPTKSLLVSREAEAAVRSTTMRLLLGSLESEPLLAKRLIELVRGGA